MRGKMAWALLPVMFLALSGLTHARSWSREQVYRAGYQHGFRDGLRRGAFDYRNGGYRGLHPRAYRDDAGYSGHMGHRGDYRKGYRDGFRVGYHEGAYGRGGRRYPRHGIPYPGGYPNYPFGRRY